MKVTEVRLKRVINKDPIKAWGSITLDGEFVIHGIRVIEVGDKSFVAMPSRRSKEGKFLDICHPTKPEVRDEIRKAVFEAYEKLNKNET